MTILCVKAVGASTKPREQAVMDALVQAGYSLVQTGTDTVTQALVDASSGIVLLPGASSSALNTKVPGIYAAPQPKPFLSLVRGGGSLLGLTTGNSANSSSRDSISVQSAAVGQAYMAGKPLGNLLWNRDPTTQAATAKTVPYLNGTSAAALIVAARLPNFSSAIGYALLPAGSVVAGAAVSDATTTTVARRAFLTMAEADADAEFLGPNAYDVLKAAATWTLGADVPPGPVVGAIVPVRRVVLDVAAVTTGAVSWALTSTASQQQGLAATEGPEGVFTFTQPDPWTQPVTVKGTATTAAGGVTAWTAVVQPPAGGSGGAEFMEYVYDAATGTWK